ncbi:restriction endonuclease subunit S [Providencia rettgeri]
MSEWFSTTLGNIEVDFIDGDRGKNYPSQNDFNSDGYCLFLNTKNVRKNGFDFSSLQFITEVKDSQLRKGKLQIGDIVLTTRGTIGNTALYNKEILFKNIRINSGMVIIRTNPLSIHNIYFLYFLRDLDYESIISGSAQPQLPIRDLKKVELMLPPLLEQKAIASVLSALDNKIDLLHRQNKTLESMAETLFRQWFVEEAQDDWEEVNVLNIFSLVGGGTPKTSIDEYWNGNIPWISGGDISQSHKGFISKTEQSITELGLKSSSTKLLPKFSTIISARGTVGRYAMLEQEMCFSQSNYGIIPKGHNCYYFVYLLIGFIVDELLAAAYGSVFDTITTRTFESVDLKLPEMTVIANFEKTVIEFFKKKESNTKQIQTLEKLRDTLLPKLMSGEVRVNYTTEEIKQ